MGAFVCKRAHSRFKVTHDSSGSRGPTVGAAAGPKPQQGSVLVPCTWCAPVCALVNAGLHPSVCENDDWVKGPADPL